MSPTDHPPFIHLAGLLALALVPALWRAHGQARAAAVVAGLVGLISCLYLWNAGPYLVPTGAITFLKEGREEAILHALWEREAWLGWMVPEWVLPLRATVFLHVVESVAALALLVPVARVSTTPAGAVAIVGLTALNPWFMNAAHSEGHAIPLLLCTALAAAVAGVPRDAALLPRLGATFVVGLTLCAAAALRIESLLVAAPVATALVAGWSSPGLVGRVDARLARLPWPLTALLLLATTTVALAAMYVAGDAMPGTTGVRVAAPWSSVSWHDLRLPRDLLAFGSPGLAVLVLTGMVFGVRDLRTFALAFGTLWASRLYSQASHLGAAPYETLRYMGMLLGPMALLAVQGARVFDCGPRSTRVWPWLALATLAVPRVLAPPELRGPPWILATSVQQRGAQFMVEAVEENRGCVLQTRVATSVAPGQTADSPGALRFADAFYGWPLREASPQVGGLPPDAPCLLLVSALDCNLPGAGCAVTTTGHDTPDRREVEAPESNLHHGRRISPAVFSITRLR